MNENNMNEYNINENNMNENRGTLQNCIIILDIIANVFSHFGRWAYNKYKGLGNNTNSTQMTTQSISINNNPIAPTQNINNSYLNIDNNNKKKSEYSTQESSYNNSEEDYNSQNNNESESENESENENDRYNQYDNNKEKNNINNTVYDDAFQEKENKKIFNDTNDLYINHKEELNYSIQENSYSDDNNDEDYNSQNNTPSQYNDDDFELNQEIIISQNNNNNQIEDNDYVEDDINNFEYKNDSEYTYKDGNNSDKTDDEIQNNIEDKNNIDFKLNEDNDSINNSVYDDLFYTAEDQKIKSKTLNANITSNDSKPNIEFIKEEEIKVVDFSTDCFDILLENNDTPYFKVLDKSVLEINTLDCSLNEYYEYKEGYNSIENLYKAISIKNPNFIVKDNKGTKNNQNNNCDYNENNNINLTAITHELSIIEENDTKNIYSQSTKNNKKPKSKKTSSQLINSKSKKINKEEKLFKLINLRLKTLDKQIKLMNEENKKLVKKKLVLQDKSNNKEYINNVREINKHLDNNREKYNQNNAEQQKLIEVKKSLLYPKNLCLSY